MHCPNCQSNRTIKYGRIHNGKQRYRCNDCGRQFVENSSYQFVSHETRELIDRLLLERLSLAGIARAAQVSLRWLQDYVNQKLEEEPSDLEYSTEINTQRPGFEH
ncbi:MAG: IS1 family transposase [Geitlerinemataceae cyanobacterium]|mgnify:CR=1 FL=1